MKKRIWLLLIAAVLTFSGCAGENAEPGAVPDTEVGAEQEAGTEQEDVCLQENPEMHGLLAYDGAFYSNSKAGICKIKPGEAPELLTDGGVLGVGSEGLYTVKDGTVYLGEKKLFEVDVPEGQYSSIWGFAEGATTAVFLR